MNFDALVRFALARFSTVLINMFVLVMALPFFLPAMVLLPVMMFMLSLIRT